VQSLNGIPCRELRCANSQSETEGRNGRVQEFRGQNSESQKSNYSRNQRTRHATRGDAYSMTVCRCISTWEKIEPGDKRFLQPAPKRETLGHFNYCSACSMWYSFSLRYSVVLPIPSIRAAASLSPRVSRKVRKIARLSSSSSGNNSSLSGARSLDG
jgi:hypothetical protein